MPLIGVDATTIKTTCAHPIDGKPCGHARSLAVSDLVLGYPDDPNAIVLPPCPACGARETLFRTWSVAGEHRAAVNALAQQLIAIGQSHPDHAAAHAAEASAPPHMMALPWAEASEPKERAP